MNNLIESKLTALSLILVGILSTLIEPHDATFCIFSLLVGIPMLLSKESWID